ncbi:Oidioi.mRNA.OKI2018_I69.PAR.g9168.t1.cds [Oikopleura dioica]|uniref:Oidioi.mRNA.OKI2018_I69.PAR.g9168.t1.cds n=1 Tax=Oikopleura dioica TaxID=34765 RepID=A0ABN7RRX4_OIKDI|nr:Oidioi.mRNA.OKI2018_I69.PAR.g9168.t1.cds [Oikopleura dioica]
MRPEESELYKERSTPTAEEAKFLKLCENDDSEELKRMLGADPNIKLAILKKYTNDETIFHKLAWWRSKNALRTTLSFMSSFSTQYKNYKDSKKSKENQGTMKYKADFRFIQNYEDSMDEEEKEEYERAGKTFLEQFLDEKDASGCTALQNAILRYVPRSAGNDRLSEDSELCIRLIADRQYDYNSQDNTGMTPIMDAISSGHLEIVRILLERSCSRPDESQKRDAAEMVNPYLEDKRENNLKVYVEDATDEIRDYFIKYFEILDPEVFLQEERKQEERKKRKSPVEIDS